MKWLLIQYKIFALGDIIVNDGSVLMAVITPKIKEYSLTNLFTEEKGIVSRSFLA